MSIIKKKIGLIVESIEFTQKCIVYRVVTDIGIDIDVSGPVVCSNDIRNKDLVLRPTFIDKNNMEVVFSTDNVTPQFYQSILNKSIRNLAEYEVEINNIYSIGETAGYVITE